MSLFQAAILGLIQGLTEFLPISSSGHLIFLPKLLGWQDQGVAFDAIVHLGTLLAVLLFFRGRIKILLTSDRRLTVLLILSVIPAVILGLVLETQSRSAILIAINLIIWGIVLGIAEYYHRYRERKAKPLEELSTLSAGKMTFIACAQALALLPGTSRSGITLSAGIFSSLTKKTAAELSFLMSIPVIVLAGGAKAVEVTQVGLGNISVAALLVGVITSALSGILAIWLLFRIIERWSLYPFVVYRIIIGILILFYLV